MNLPRFGLQKLSSSLYNYDLASQWSEHKAASEEFNINATSTFRKIRPPSYEYVVLLLYKGRMKHFSPPASYGVSFADFDRRSVDPSSSRKLIFYNDRLPSGCVRACNSSMQLHFKAFSLDVYPPAIPFYTGGFDVSTYRPVVELVRAPILSLPDSIANRSPSSSYHSAGPEKDAVVADQRARRRGALSVEASLALARRVDVGLEVLALVFGAAFPGHPLRGRHVSQDCQRREKSQASSRGELSRRLYVSKKRNLLWQTHFGIEVSRLTRIVLQQATPVRNSTRCLYECLSDTRGCKVEIQTFEPPSVPQAVITIMRAVLCYDFSFFFFSLMEVEMALTLFPRSISQFSNFSKGWHHRIQLFVPSVSSLKRERERESESARQKSSSIIHHSSHELGPLWSPTDHLSRGQVL
ncbi:hypothetical protein MBM_08130 [Drepanopeziza brunnea f. sp. 'multigermtubi' MB_m1]|uniref:Uncharacterized protein n=1 Tax=Marssonina brunnea f. sp. multigermtubi (strain MB_m1) TaxID=1072389 RepID=K1XN57_MARBU|nr:uncharacterized protein MBM_08130 [Drepanopeziza brunnea f. sp. 'multigermtubi' MB_m1]EKD13929.1 hypothetical protein MBM_08130 [Drepanopeziza brunnea f. sp. 'multigermtubi' MB_m1]